MERARRFASSQSSVCFSGGAKRGIFVDESANRIHAGVDPRDLREECGHYFCRRDIAISNHRGELDGIFEANVYAWHYLDSKTTLKKGFLN
jgi:hypothetical protein